MDLLEPLTIVEDTMMIEGTGIEWIEVLLAIAIALFVMTMPRAEQTEKANGDNLAAEEAEGSVEVETEIVLASQAFALVVLVGIVVAVSEIAVAEIAVAEIAVEEAIVSVIEAIVLVIETEVVIEVGLGIEAALEIEVAEVGLAEDSVIEEATETALGAAVVSGAAAAKEAAAATAVGTKGVVGLDVILVVIEAAMKVALGEATEEEDLALIAEESRATYGLQRVIDHCN